MNARAVSTWIKAHLPRNRTPFTFRLQLWFVLAAAALLGIGGLLQTQLHRFFPQEPWQLTSTGWDPLAWFVWLMAAPAVLLLVTRFPIARGETARNLPRRIACSLALYAIVVNVRYVIRVLPRLWDDTPFVVDWPGYWALNLAALPMDFLTFGGFFSAALAIDHYTKYRQRLEETLALRLRTALLESELARAELSTLRDQLHPHFLFNSFNAVATLVRQQRNDAAVEVIAQLSMLLRLAIQRTGRHELTLEEELEFIRRYLAIEHVRFGDKLQSEFSIEPEVLQARIPNLLLQPLVENAIKHGISRRTTPGRLRVGAQFMADELEIVIENDGPPPGTAPLADDAAGYGIGLSNTRSRLERIYGTRFRLELLPLDDGGMRVRLALPRDAALAASAQR